MEAKYWAVSSSTNKSTSALSSNPPAPLIDPSKYTIAILCVLEAEHSAILDVLDGKTTIYPNLPDEENIYRAAQIDGNNILVVRLQKAGKTAAIKGATELTSIFKELHLILLVGVCGGLPKTNEGKDLFKGDIIISNRIVRYWENGRIQDDAVKMRGTDDQQSYLDGRLKSISRDLESDDMMQDLRDKLVERLTRIQEITTRRGMKKYEYPGLDKDKVYEEDYLHMHRHMKANCSCYTGEICDTAEKTPCEDLQCDATKVARDRSKLAMENYSPNIYVGGYGSDDYVMRSVKERQRILKKYSSAGLIGFEMEAGGLFDLRKSRARPMMIKAVCDYSDSHKDKHWQYYAAATAACAARALISIYYQSAANESIPQELSSEETLRVVQADSASQRRREVTESPVRYPFEGNNMRASSSIPDYPVYSLSESMPNFSETTIGESYSSLMQKTRNPKSIPRSTPCREANESFKAKQYKLIKHKHSIQYITMQNNLLAATDRDGQVTIWDAYTAEKLGSFGTCKHVKAASLCIDLDYVCVREDACGSSIWDWKKKHPVFALQSENKSLVSLVENSNMAVFWFSDTELWKVVSPTWKVIRLTKLPAEAVSFRDLNSRLALLLENTQLLWVDSVSGKIESATFLPGEVEMRHLHPLISIAEDESQIAITISDEAAGHIYVKIWNPDTKSLSSLHFEGYVAPNTKPAWTSWFVKGKLMAVFFAGYVDVINIVTKLRKRLYMPFQASFIQTKQGREVLPRMNGRRIMSTQPCLCMKDRKMIATRTNEGAIQLWDLDFEVDEF